MAEWSKAAVSKTVNPPSGILGFESPSLRPMQSFCKRRTLCGAIVKKPTVKSVLL